MKIKLLTEKRIIAERIIDFNGTAEELENLVDLKDSENIILMGDEEEPRSLSLMEKIYLSPLVSVQEMETRIDKKETYFGAFTLNNRCITEIK